MNPQELRIGNYVSYRDERECIVSCLGHKFETENMNNGLACGSDDIQEYKPIPLTEEWLIKFGFYSDVINEGDDPVYVLGDFYIDYHTLQPIDFGFPVAKTNINNVHELQNLYFALTGEELTIKN